MSSTAAWGLKAGSVQDLDATDAPTGTARVSEAYASVEEQPMVENPELLNGVGKLLDRTRTDLRLMFTVTLRDATPDDIADLYGATVVTDVDGTTIKRKPGDRPSPKRFRFITGANGEGAGWEKVIHKGLIITPPPVSFSDSAYTDFTFEVEALENADGDFVDDIPHPVALAASDLNTL